MKPNNENIKQSDTQEQTKRSNSEEIKQNFNERQGKNGKETPRVQSHGRVCFDFSRGH